jgi:hypothetical protein
MTPILARFHGWRVRLHCLTGDHEWTTDVPVDAAGQRQAILRERCLHCGVVTVGLSLADGPRYTVTQAADRARLTLHNARLKKCPCGGCDAARTARRARRPKVSPIRRTA